MEWSFTVSPKPIQVEKNTRIVMKQYTNESQTAKLIEMLPPIIVWKRRNLASTIARTTFNSFVSYAELDGTPHIVENSTELIDALYDMIIKLKKEVVI